MRIAVIAAPYPLEEFPSPPLGISYVAAAFEKAGCEVRIFDYIISSYSREKLAAQLAEFQPDAVGAGCVTLNFYDAQRILRDVKSCNPDILTMIGGPHVSFTAEETLKHYPEIDVVFLGEADDTIVEFVPLMFDREKWPGVLGIAYRQDEQIIRNGRRDLIQDIDHVPMPLRRLLSSSRYRALGFSVSMITGRGCPHGCIFCVGRKMVGAKVRRRSPKLVLDEIEEILGLGYERINIADDLFASDTERVKIICNGIQERNLKFIWSAFARVDTVTQEMFDAMASAGCDSVSFGVESGNPEMLKRIRKGIKLDQVRTSVIMCKQAGMIPHASFMVGLPGETRETLRQTAEFAKSLDIQYGYHYLTPFPGTTLCEKIHKYDLEILTRDWSKYDANDAIVRTSELSPQDIRDFVALYDNEVNSDWQKVVENYKTGRNTPYDDMRVEGNQRMHMTFKILKEDLVEKYGFIDAGSGQGRDDAGADILAKRIQNALPGDPELIEKTVHDFIHRGYLKVEVSDKGLIWRWA
ncbi:MAG TPA: radical SAM protein [Smithellaceae bacterium]|jgi:anaerobic magnesium-protoporphyrin IX monomethyl ester cyclase|nr:radical SAM protein [Smithellaceae bacterium]HQM46731.1 radical SAM protein [Smithellaceae bacterium]